MAKQIAFAALRRASARQRPIRHGMRVLTMLGILTVFLGMPGFTADTPVVIKLWNTDFLQKKFYQQIFKAFNAANPGIKVDYTAQTSTDVMTKALEVAFRAGEPPDLFTAGIPFFEAAYPGSVAKDVELGWLTPLDSVAPSTQALADWMARFPQERQPFVENVNVFSGKVYSWPVSITAFNTNWFTWPASLTAIAGPLLYNARLFREAGLKGSDGKPAAPETWDDLRLFANKITQLGQGKVYGIVDDIEATGVWRIAMSAGFPDFGWNYWGWGFDYRTGRHDFASPHLKGAVQLWIDMKKDGSVFPGSLSISTSHALDNFNQELAGMIMMYAGSPTIDESQEFEAVLPPARTKGQPVALHIPPLAYFSGYVISNKAKDKEAAIWKLIDFMTSREYQESFVKVMSTAGLKAISVFPQFNKPELFPNPVYAKIADLTLQSKIGPNLRVGTQEVGRFFDSGRPYMEDAIKGIYNGQLGLEALDEMDVRFDAALDKALADAKKEGINLTRADFTFPDYDPAKDYVTKKK